jgi:predicted regulator of Ras-like GTPase activity (Roadblock/LC7/MglB family)
VPLSAPAQDLQSTINTFAARVPEVTAAALASSDGLLVTASNGMDPDQADELAAVACGVVSIISGSTARMFDDDQVELAVARLTRRVLMVRPVDDGSVLAVIAAADVDIEAVGKLVGDLARRIGQVITPDLRAELQRTLPL